jgi:hypothetical protein
VFRYYLLRLPNLVDSALLPGTALGSALGIHQVGRRLELVAWRSAGISRFRLLVFPALSAGLVLASLQFFLRSGVMPETRPEADVLAERLGVADPGLRIFLMQRHWIATQRGFMRVGAARRGGRLSDVLYLEMGKRFSPRRILEAKNARFVGSAQAMDDDAGFGTLRLEDAREVKIGSRKKDSALEACLDGFRKSTDPRDEGIWSCLEREKTVGLVETRHEAVDVEIEPGVRRLALLVGHPGGFKTGELWTLVQTGAEKGHDLSPFSAELRRRFSGPLWLMLAVFLAALAAASDNHKAGIEIPLVVTAGIAILSFVGQTIQDQVASAQGPSLGAITAGLLLGWAAAGALIVLRQRS